MDNIFRLKKQHIQIDPNACILKANEYVSLVEANAMLQAARDEALLIKQEAQKTFEEEKIRGYEEGLEEGRLEMAERTFEAIAKGIDFIESLEKTTVDLVMKSLQRILDEMPPEERVVSVVRRSLSYVRGQKDVIIHVCPEDLSLVQDEIASLTNTAYGIDSIRIVADAKLSAGACVLESNLGIIDASLSVQMAVLRRVFEEHLKKV